MKRGKTDDWFPLYVDKWLFGSTRIELKPDERGVFVDLMALSKKDMGFIRANKGTPYLDNQLSGMLNISLKLLKRTVDKCVKFKKIEKLTDGTLYIMSHNVYKLSSRYRRKIAAQWAGKAVHKDRKSGPQREIKIDNPILILRGEEREKETSSPPLPAIPKGLEFKIQDELKSLLAEIRQVERKIADKDFQKKSPASHNDLLCKLKQRQKKYRELIEDYS